VSLGMETYTAGVTIQRMVDRICRFAQASDVGAVWCVLQGQTMIRLAVPTARRLRVPLATQVWEPPGWSLSRQAQWGRLAGTSAARGRLGGWGLL
jgi:hypothetical protein